jgi:hypothetical protein
MQEEKILQLAEHYEQQFALYLEMLSIVKDQHLLSAEADFGGEDDLGKLNLLLLKRREIMDQVEANQEKIQAIKKKLQSRLDLEELSIKSLSRYFPSPHLVKLLSKIRKIEDILKKIAGFDQETQKNLLDKLKLVGKELGAVQKRKRINEVYYPAERQREGYFIDHNK